MNTLRTRALSAEWRRVIPGSNILFVVYHYVSGSFQIGGICKRMPLIKIMPSTMLRIVLRKAELSKYMGDIVVEAVER